MNARTLAISAFLLFGIGMPFFIFSAQINGTRQTIFMIMLAYVLVNLVMFIQSPSMLADKSLLGLSLALIAGLCIAGGVLAIARSSELDQQQAALHNAMVVLYPIVGVLLTVLATYVVPSLTKQVLTLKQMFWLLAAFFCMFMALKK